MLLKLVFIITTFLLYACGGEKYDVSNATNILPEREDSLTPDYSLRSVPVVPVYNEYYSGSFNYKNIAYLSSINSNFEVLENRVYYVNKKMELIAIDLATSKKIIEVNLISKGFDIKKSNIKYTNLTVNDKEAVITTNLGSVFYVDLTESKLLWTAKINNITPLKPLIVSDEVFVFNGAGGLTSYSKKTGEVVFGGVDIEDQTGINFETVKGLEPIFIPSTNLALSYYRGDLLFFDTRTKSRFAVPLIESVMNFGRITSSPIVSGGGIFTSTTINLTAVSSYSGAKVWALNGNFNRSFGVGDFIFALAGGKHLIAVYKQNGKIRFNTELKTENIFLVPISREKFFVINSKGEGLFYNLSTGEFIEKSKNNFYSDEFDYKLIDGKIYYTKGDNLIVLN